MYYYGDDVNKTSDGDLTVTVTLNGDEEVGGTDE